MRKCFAVLCVCMILMACVLPASAETGKVTYKGGSEKFIFEPGTRYSPTDLFPDLKDVMPGDSITQHITVKNKASEKVKVMIYMRALGAHEGSEEFLSQLRLRVKKSDNNTMAYMFDAAADETAQLTDWVCLGTLYSGGKVNLDVILDVPVELDNRYQKQVGYLDWEFAVVEYMVESTDPEAPQTGDQSNIYLWAAIMAGSFILLILLFFFRKRKDKK